jgi:hypothetical protein
LAALSICIFYLFNIICLEEISVIICSTTGNMICATYINSNLFQSMVIMGAPLHYCSLQSGAQEAHMSVSGSRGVSIHQAILDVEMEMVHKNEKKINFNLTKDCLAELQAIADFIDTEYFQISPIKAIYKTKAILNIKIFLEICRQL